MLNTETNTPAMRSRVLAAARKFLHHHRDIDAFFEHGQWWITHGPTGAQWSVNDLNDNDFCFEQVTQGDDD